jgi:hypothetical protein
LYVPATHAEQVVPPSGEARLPVQAVHVAVPGVFLNVCLAQALHAPPFGPEYPALQMQLVEKILACAEFAPTEQAVQAALPAAALKVPATQGRHGPLLAPV